MQSDAENSLISWLEWHYARETERIELVALVQKRQASKWWRLKSKVKEIFKHVF
jgi:hypothetical protein